ncbi:hypothetical protein CWC05_17780 [Pseudoalteromonas ruthenica]|uniref:Uncharacterized protein n=1 Tax=Pseudoalteromonas ruthenica TaxID=151081 RepID=A0A5S3Z0F5_9GAMM|nr:DUF6445 family protein [Pseudoalteromonas ruthenica]TMP85638.1 hypothetical protein CWC05_17780 [Pseudoalteromonas ruthenica]
MYTLNLDYQANVIAIPATNESVVVVDDFLANPEQVIHYAKTTAYFNPPGTDRSFYPGKRDKMPLPYKRALSELLNSLRDRGLLQLDGKVDIYRNELSLTTVKESQLSLFQKAPHIDSLDNKDYATVHYLCSEQHGGTSFYCYRPTGMAQFSDDNAVKNMLKSIQHHAHSFDGYIQGDSDLFERVLSVPAKFNRIIIYQGNILHSADLKGQHNQQDDIDNGRLSVASFFYLE